MFPNSYPDASKKAFEATGNAQRKLHPTVPPSASSAINKNCYWSADFFNNLLEIFLGDVGALAQLAQVTDPDVPLEAHDDGGVDGRHQRDLDDGQQPG